MPIYEYQCTGCHHQFDQMQKIHDQPITLCPECHKETLTKLVSAAGFQLKGSGWYATDFKNSGSAPKPADNKESAAVTNTETTKKDATSSTKGESE